MSVHAGRWHDALCTWVNRGGQLKAELQLAADMICRQPPTQRIAHHPISADKRQKQTEKKREDCEVEMQGETGREWES